MLRDARNYQISLLGHDSSGLARTALAGTSAWEAKAFTRFLHRGLTAARICGTLTLTPDCTYRDIAVSATPRRLPTAIVRCAKSHD